MTDAVKSMLTNTAAHFDNHMRRYLGVAPSLIMTGNYARMLFKEENADIILDLDDLKESQYNHNQLDIVVIENNICSVETK